MSIEIKVPQLPESVSDATLVTWHKKVGDKVSRDENLVDLETDKVVLEVPAPADGTLGAIKVDDGATVTAGQVLAMLEEGAGAAGAADEGDDAADATDEAANDREEAGDGGDADDAGAEGEEKQQETQEGKRKSSHKLSPSVRRLLDEHDLDATIISGSGKDGRITKSDVMDYIRSHSDEDTAPDDESEPAPPEPVVDAAGERSEERVPMTRLRARIAERMVEAQQTAAMLTTFNEVDLSEVMALRARYKDKFAEVHGTKLGFMSFFSKASVEALRQFPVVNASVEDKDIVYHNYFDIGIAVSSERGLLVPVLRDVDRMSFADIENRIAELGRKAREGSIGMDDLTGGTFTITNGGIFGSMLSTPILNPPQSAILGMHAIQERPMAIDGEVVIRPMMYVALTYDHRIIDGREAVQFLAAIKHALEDPSRLLLQL